MNYLVCGDGTKVLLTPIAQAATAMEAAGRDAIGIIADALQRSAVIELAHIVAVWVHNSTLADMVIERKRLRTQAQYQLAAQLRQLRKKREAQAWVCTSGRPYIADRELAACYFEQLKRKPRRKVGGKRYTA